MRDAWEHRTSGPVLHITPWERDALQLLADGCTVNELGSCLGFSAADIESLLANLFVVMGAATQTEAIAAANKRGLLNHESIPVRNTLELVKP